MSAKARSLNAAVEAATEHFALRGFAKTRLAEIAEAAQCSTETIYAAYVNKLGLFEHCVRTFYGKHFDAVSGALEPGEKAIVAYRRGLIAVGVQASNPIMRGLERALATERGQVDRALLAEIAEIQEAWRRRYMAIAQAAMAQGHLITTKSPDAITMMCVAFVSYHTLGPPYLWSDEAPSYLSLAALADQALGFVLTPEGAAILAHAAMSDPDTHPVTYAMG